MTLPLIVYRSLRQHLFSTLVTAGSLALAGGLLMSVWMVKAQAQRSFLQTTTAVDAVTPLARGDSPNADPALVALFIAMAALARTESRGGHCRTDFPGRKPVAERRLQRMADLEQPSKVADAA